MKRKRWHNSEPLQRLIDWGAVLATLAEQTHNRESYTMNYAEFTDYISTLVSDFDANEWEEHSDFAHECADSSEHVIYTAKAWDLVNMIRINDSELLDHKIEISESFEDIDQFMVETAYNIIAVSVMDKLWELDNPRRIA